VKFAAFRFAKAAVVALFILLEIPGAHAYAQGTPDGTDVDWLIANPCRSWDLLETGYSQPRVVCDGVFAGDQASIQVPAPYLHFRLPELALVDVPFVLQFGWTPGSFGWADSPGRTVRWTDNRIEGYRIQLALSPSPRAITSQPGTTMDGNLALSTIDSRLMLSDGAGYARFCAASSLGNLPRGLGGLGLCPAAMVEPQLPKDLLSGPSGAERDRYSWDAVDAFQGGWFGGFSQWASVTGSGLSGGHPAYRVQVGTGWALYARVQWDAHWRRLQHQVQYCGWEYYGQPGWYWDWSQWPPVCIDATESHWEKFCPGDHPEAGCPTIRYGAHYGRWRYLGEFESGTIYIPGQGYLPNLDLVVLQSQALLTVP
jgi:hypothetical protein